MKQTDRVIEVATVPLDLSAGGPLMLRTRALAKSRLLMAEIDYGEHGVGEHADFPRWGDAFSIGVRFLPETSVTSVHGKRFNFSAPSGYTHFLYLSGVDFVELATRRHSIEMLLPRTFLREIAEDLEVPAVTHLGNDACFIRADPVIPGLARRIQPYFNDPDALDSLYADSFMWMLGIYVMRRYGDLASRRPITGGLTTWQERIAKELIEANLSDGIALEELASWCGLRVSQFAHAFKRSVGMPPYRWLMRRRVERAMTLLRSPNASLAEIGARCGFADQSHFSRVFAAHVGTGPATWRRQI